MSDWKGRLDRAAGATTCDILSNVGGALTGYGAVSLAFGGAGVVPLTVGMISLLAMNYGCQWDPDGPNTYPTGGGIEEGQCMETVGCDLILKGKGGQFTYLGPVRKLISSVASGTYPNGSPKCTTRYIDCDGIEQTDDESISDLWPITTEVQEGGVCVGDPSPPPPPLIPPYEYIEPDGPNGEPGCTLNVEFLDWGVEDSGQNGPIFKISPGENLRAGGGRIGGCNFEPVIYYQPNLPGTDPDGGGGGNPPPPQNPPIPFPPGGDANPDEWLDRLKDALTTAAGILVGNLIKDLLEIPYEGVVYEMPAPCDVDEEGNQLVWTGTIPQQVFQKAILDRVDAISNQISQHLAWKTPICEPPPVKLEGDWRTISFRSDEVSPYGKSRLRKRLRYRSVSGIGLGELVDHWKDFTFEAGGVVVGHVGGPWGTPKVWAASEHEGKRVLLHAAGEAGFDPDQVGEWKVGVSRGTRLGVSGTMRIDTTGGFYWITNRDGSDARPIVAKPSYT